MNLQIFIEKRKIDINGFVPQIITVNENYIIKRYFA